MTLSEYLRKPKDYRGEWDTERWDIPNWEEERKKYMGKRTLMTNIDGATCLVVEGLSLEIIDDTDWKKPDAVRKEISRQCLKFFTERGIDLTGINSRLSKQGTATLSVSFEISGTEELNRIIEKIRQIDSVIDIERAAT
jgi:hypothetical protein